MTEEADSKNSAKYRASYISLVTISAIHTKTDKKYNTNIYYALQ